MYEGWNCHRLVYNPNVFGSFLSYFLPSLLDISVDYQNENKATRATINTVLRISGVNFWVFSTTNVDRR